METSAVSDLNEHTWLSVIYQEKHGMLEKEKNNNVTLRSMEVKYFVIKFSLLKK